MSPIFLFLSNALAAIPGIMQAFTSLTEATAAVKAHVDGTIAKIQQMQIEKRNPTSAEWDEQNALIAQLLGNLNKEQEASGSPATDQV